MSLFQFCCPFFCVCFITRSGNWGIKQTVGLRFHFLFKWSHCLRQKPWFPRSLVPTQSAPSQVPATDGDKRCLPFEDVVLGFCVNSLFRISLVGCLLLLILRKVPGGVKREGEAPISPEQLCKFKSFKEKWDKNDTGLFTADFLFSSLQPLRPNTTAYSSSLTH